MLLKISHCTGESPDKDYLALSVGSTKAEKSWGRSKVEAQASESKRAFF